jgi:hypothetical protein
MLSRSVIRTCLTASKQPAQIARSFSLLARATSSKRSAQTSAVKSQKSTFTLNWTAKKSPTQLYFGSFIQKNNYTTASGATTPKLDVLVENESYKLIVKLPSSTEASVFILKPLETVRDLINDIREEDPKANTVVFHYLDGLRVSHSTTIDDLLKSEFHLTIEGTKYHVVPPKEKIRDSLNENVLSVMDLRSLMHKAYYHRILLRLESDQRHHMPYSEYLEWCREYGLSDEESLNLAHHLHEVGLILHFAGNPELKDYIFLNPQLVANSITKALQLRYIKKGDELKLAELEAIKQELAPLHDLKLTYDEQADNYGRRVLLWSGIYLAAQFSLLARLVWVEFNWDIMEPITYFVTLGTMIWGYTFFTFTKTDYSYPAFKDRIARRKLRAIYLKNEFNWKRWNTLYNRAKHLEDELALPVAERFTTQDPDKIRLPKVLASAILSAPSAVQTTD